MCHVREVVAECKVCNRLKHGTNSKAHGHKRQSRQTVKYCGPDNLPGYSAQSSVVMSDHGVSVKFIYRSDGISTLKVQVLLYDTLPE